MFDNLKTENREVQIKWKQLKELEKLKQVEHFFSHNKINLTLHIVWHLIVASYVWHHMYVELFVWNIICKVSYTL